jgi:hypothetical protein
MTLTAESVRRTLRDGTLAQRRALVDRLPRHPLKSTARALMESASPATSLAALAALARRYCFGSQPEVGAALAAGVHAHGCDLMRDSPAHSLLDLALSGVAIAHVSALMQLSRHEEIVAVTARYAAIHEDSHEENARTLRLLQVESLIALGRHDDAAERLAAEPELFTDLTNSIEARRLKARLDAIRGTTLLIPRARESSQRSGAG